MLAPVLPDSWVAPDTVPTYPHFKWDAHGLEANKRNDALLRLGYVSGVLMSELCGLCWKDTQSRSEGQG